MLVCEFCVSLCDMTVVRYGKPKVLYSVLTAIDLTGAW